MITRLLVRYYIWRRDLCVRRLVAAGVSGNKLLDEENVAYWQGKIRAAKHYKSLLRRTRCGTCKGGRNVIAFGHEIRCPECKGCGYSD